MTKLVNAGLLPFKNGEHNSESASIIDRVITLLITLYMFLILDRGSLEPPECAE